MADQHARVVMRGSGALPVPRAQSAPRVVRAMSEVDLWACRLAVVEQVAAHSDCPESRVAVAAARAELAVARARAAADVARGEVARFASHGGGR